MGYLFSSDEQAFATGAAYNFQHNTWSNTYYGSYEASLVGYVALRATGELLSPYAVNTAIDMVRNGVRSYDGATGRVFSRQWFFWFINAFCCRYDLQRNHGCSKRYARRYKSRVSEAKPDQ